MIMMVLAGAVYFVQARVSLWTMPEQQKKQMKACLSTYHRL